MTNAKIRFASGTILAAIILAAAHGCVAHENQTGENTADGWPCLELTTYNEWYIEPRDSGKSDFSGYSVYTSLHPDIWHYYSGDADCEGRRDVPPPPECACIITAEGSFRLQNAFINTNVTYAALHVPEHRYSGCSNLLEYVKCFPSLECLLIEIENIEQRKEIDMSVFLAFPKLKNLEVAANNCRFKNLKALSSAPNLAVLRLNSHTRMFSTADLVDIRQVSLVDDIGDAGWQKLKILDFAGVVCFNQDYIPRLKTVTEYHPPLLCSYDLMPPNVEILHLERYANLDPPFMDGIVYGPFAYAYRLDAYRNLKTIHVKNKRQLSNFGKVMGEISCEYTEASRGSTFGKWEIKDEDGATIKTYQIMNHHYD